jgi:DNA-directed RNA polymerase specialized sigma24 family protein
MEMSEQASSEDLVRIIRAAQHSEDWPRAQEATTVLLVRHEPDFVRLAHKRLATLGMLQDVADAASAIRLRVLEDLRGEKPERRIATVFRLYLKEVSRDVLDSFLREEGVRVRTRHKGRATPAQPHTVPRTVQVSLSDPYGEDETMTVGETVPDPTPTPEEIVLRQHAYEDLLLQLTSELRLAVLVYGDMKERGLSYHQVAQSRGISVARAKALYTDGNRIMKRAKEQGNE